MRKLFLLITGLLFFSGGVLNASKLETFPSEGNVECESYATIVGLIYAGEGHSYWEGYFAGYSYCLQNQQ